MDMESFRKLYAEWRPPVLIISSILSQILLITLSYRRIRNLFRSPISRIIWRAVYLTADYVATLSLWCIFHVYMEPKESGGSHRSNNYLFALWAPLILLHLGRHGKITTFTLQDNEFWPKQAVSFLLCVCTTLFLCIGALIEIQVPIIWPSSLMFFIVGSLKFGERICSLTHGSMKRLNSNFEKPEPGPDIHGFASKQKLSDRQGEPMLLPPEQLIIDVNDERQVQADDGEPVHSADQFVRSLCTAYKSFNRYKGLYADVRFTSIEKNTPNVPLGEIENLIEIELGFAHDLFYNKSIVTHTKKGWIVRVTTTLLIILATVFFKQDKGKHGLYATLLATTSILLELATLVVDAALSEWVLVKAGFLQGNKWRNLENGVLFIRQKVEVVCRTPCLKLGQHSILSFCSNDRNPQSCWKQILDFFERKEFWDNTRNTYYISLDNELKTRIVEQISERVALERNLITATLFQLAPLSESVETIIGRGMNLNIIQPLQFGEAVVVWHLATDLCYRTFTKQPPPLHLQHANVISNYMLYLLVEHPSMLSLVVKTENRYQDACAAVRLFSTSLDDDQGPNYEILEEKYNNDNSCPQEINSLLWDGFKIARELKENQTWNLLFEVWVDLLSHAAIYCKGQHHAEQLSSGGELLTYVWVFLIHSFIG